MMWEGVCWCVDVLMTAPGPGQAATCQVWGGDFFWQSRAGVIRQCHGSPSPQDLLLLSCAWWWLVALAGGRPDSCRDAPIYLATTDNWDELVSNTPCPSTPPPPPLHHHLSTLSSTDNLLQLSDPHRLIRSFVSDQNVSEIRLQSDGVNNNGLFPIWPATCYVQHMMCLYIVWPVSIKWEKSLKYETTPCSCSYNRH